MWQQLVQLGLTQTKGVVLVDHPYQIVAQRQALTARPLVDRLHDLPDVLCVLWAGGGNPLGDGLHDWHGLVAQSRSDLVDGVPRVVVELQTQELAHARGLIDLVGLAPFVRGGPDDLRDHLPELDDVPLGDAFG